MMRSQTDEMLAAKWDPEPYIHTASGQRGPSRYVGGWSDAILAPRVEMIPSRHIFHGKPGHRIDTGRVWPRPPVNEVLVLFRRQLLPLVPLEAHIHGFLSGITRLASEGFTVAEINHARRVLKRLAALT